jgi:PAS domain S-box-containing protein
MAQMNFEKWSRTVDGLLLVAASSGATLGILAASVGLSYLPDEQRPLIGTALLLVALSIVMLGLMRVRLRQVGVSRVQVSSLLSNVAKDYERSYRRLLNNHTDPIVLRDTDGRVTYVNQAFRTLFDCAPEDVIGKPFEPVVDSKLSTTPADRFSKLLEPPYRGQCDEYILTSSGWHWISWQDLAVLDNEGEVQEIQSTGRDITDYKAVQERFRRARDEAERASRAKSSFLATMSHEIRTPMNGVLGMADLLLAGERDAERAGYARAIKQSGEALLGLIEDILDYSKVEAGKLELDLRPFDLIDTVERVGRLLAPKAHEKGIEIATFINTDVPQNLIGDAGRLRQVLLNLAGNAVKFTDSGGIELKVSTVSRRDDGATLLFEVEDTGIGIKEGDQARLFEAFSQTGEGAAPEHGGTGLGLSICERLVELMGGQIGVESAPGDGSSFWFVAEFGCDAPIEAAGADQREYRRVMIVDDNPVSRRVIGKNMRVSGADVIAATGAEALDTLRGNEDSAPFDFLLLDFGLGEDLLAELSQAARRSGEDENAVIIALMIKPSEQDRLSSRHAEMCDMRLVKPIMKADFQRIMALSLTDEDERRQQTSGLAQFLEPLDPELGGPAFAGDLRALIAEDNRINQMLAASILKQLGIASDCVGNGAEAVEAAATGQYDLVLMDIRMPVMDGVTATREIRAGAAEGARLPIIALTANSDEEDLAAYRAAGMNEVLIKPITLSDMDLVLRKVIGESYRTAAE